MRVLQDQDRERGETAARRLRPTATSLAARLQLLSPEEERKDRRLVRAVTFRPPGCKHVDVVQRRLHETN